MCGKDVELPEGAQGLRGSRLLTCLLVIWRGLVCTAPIAHRQRRGPYLVGVLIVLPSVTEAVSV